MANLVVPSVTGPVVKMVAFLFYHFIEKMFLSKYSQYAVVNHG